MSNKLKDCKEILSELLTYAYDIESNNYFDVLAGCWTFLKNIDFLVLV